MVEPRQHVEIATPLGPLQVASTPGGICAARFDGPPGGTLGDPHGAAAAFAAWFAGDLRALAALPLDLAGTPFQRQVWAALQGIPPGAVRSYAQLSQALGGTAAGARAVGRACARNPALVCVPCHRALGAGGRLVGYAGGLPRKRWLLAHEGAPGFCVP